MIFNKNLCQSQEREQQVESFGANTTSSINPDEILYWVGTGNTEVIFEGDWCSPDVALAWGYCWNGTATVADMMADLVSHVRVVLPY